MASKQTMLQQKVIIEGQIDRQTNRQIDIQTNKQIDRQIETNKQIYLPIFFNLVFSVN